MFIDQQHIKETVAAMLYLKDVHRTKFTSIPHQ
jgi:hypothetical protein